MNYMSSQTAPLIPDTTPHCSSFSIGPSHPSSARTFIFRERQRKGEREGKSHTQITKIETFSFSQGGQKSIPNHHRTTPHHTTLPPSYSLSLPIVNIVLAKFSSLTKERRRFGDGCQIARLLLRGKLWQIFSTSSPFCADPLFFSKISLNS